MKTIELTRRQALTGCAMLPFAGASRAESRKSGHPPQILLRSSWGSANIGDIGHTPGALSLLGRYFPEAEITLWPGEIRRGARELLAASYPRLKIVEGSVGPNGLPDNPALARAWDEADLYLSGSGSGFPASAHSAAYLKATGKPLGVFGVSTDPISGIGPGREEEGGTLAEIRAKASALPKTHLPEEYRFILDRASFFFCRDTISRDYLRSQGVKTPVLEFGPDAQLGMSIRDDGKAQAFLQKNGLIPGKFICVIPRLRYTPYYRINNTPRSPSDDVRDRINERTKRDDHAKLRDMIVAWVRKTGNKVLACPEMTYQIELAKEELVDPLPDDVRSHVVWRDSYWMPDEAAGVYARAQAVVSAECHSPLIAYHNGTPAIYVRQPTDTCKGQMYRDFGANDWFFEIDAASGDQLWSRLEAIAQKPMAAKQKVKAIMSNVQSRQQRMVEAVRAATARGRKRVEGG